MQVKVVGHFTTAEKNTSANTGYVSSLVCETHESKTFKVQFKNYHPPCIGSMITIKYNHMTVTGLPKFAQLLSNSPHPIPVKPPTIPEADPPLTLSEWSKKGGYPLKNGEGVYVKSDRSNETYVVKRAQKNDSVYCSCMAWKFQKMTPTCRTCKHCVAVLGAKAAAIRVARAILEKMDVSP